MRAHRGTVGFFCLFLCSTASRAQLTIGTIEGHFRTSDGSALIHAPLLITGGPGIRLTIHTDRVGAFRITLPYGNYQIAGASVFVTPSQTMEVELNRDRPEVLERLVPGLWADSTRGRGYPEAFSLAGLLLSREPGTVTAPYDFTGLADDRLWLQSQRGVSWTSTQFRLQGIDATDPYQPGRTVVLPNLEALDEVVVRDGFAKTDSSSYGPEIGLFLREPGRGWHASLATADTGSFLTSSNLPARDYRGLVQEADGFHWFTRDGLDVGGPLASWADLFASAAGQWASQTVPLAAPGSSQQSRLLFANARGRVRAGTRDQIEGNFTGSRIDLSDWGVPAGIETLAGNRIGPSFVLPGGFPGESEVDHMDFAQGGWTREWPEASDLGALQLRYGYSTAHLDGTQASRATGLSQSRIELLDGTVSGLAPLQNFAIRTRHSVLTAWQPAARRTGPIRHELTAGGGWSTASARNRFSSPSNLELITANGVPAVVVELNTPVAPLATVRSFSVYGADRASLASGWTLEAGVLADVSRGSAGGPHPLITWNSIAPRVGFSWRIPRAHGLGLHGSYLRFYAPLAGRYLDFGNPNSLSGSEYTWTDRDGDGWFQPSERGPVLKRFGGLYCSIASVLRRPYSDEFDVGADIVLPQRTSAGIYLFRRDDKNRLAAQNIGVPPQAYTPVVLVDPGPDGITGTFDDQPLTVYQQNPATLGQDSYLLTNPPGLRELYTGTTAEIRTQWHGVSAGASLVAEKSWGPTNPGNAAIANDPGVLGALYFDPNTTLHAAGRSFFDRAYIGKVYASYRIPWGGIEVRTVADYLDGLAFARQLLVTGLAQGPFLVATTARGSPEGGNRAEHVMNWNLRVQREFPLPAGRIASTVDLMNVTNAGHAIQENDLTGPSFNKRLPVTLEASRSVRLGFRFEF